MTLVDFLLARLDEDEVLALSAKEMEIGGVPRSHPWAVFGPDRVLADVKAKREIIQWVQRWPWRAEPPSSVDGLLPSLAVVYADHPDYDPAWRP